MIKYLAAFAQSIVTPRPNAGDNRLRVYLDLNKDGRLQSSEPNVLTDASGNFSFNSLKAGNYRLRVADTLGWQSTFPVSGVVSVTAEPSNTTEVLVGVTQRSHITGIAFNDVNGNGKRDRNELPLAGIPVYLDANQDGRPGPGEGVSLTASDGSYRFTNLASGNYRIAVLLPSGDTITSPKTGYQSLRVPAGRTVAAPGFAIKAPNAFPAPIASVLGIPGAGFAVVSWTAVGGASSYLIERSTDGIQYSLLANEPASNNYYQDLQVITGTRYFYRVSATDGTATSPPSQVVSILV